MKVFPRRALIVDDEKMVQQILVKTLSQEGFDCDTADDGGQALERIAAQSYDVVVTDLRMPVVHGHALVVQLFAKPNPPLVIVLTGINEPRLKNDLLRRGVKEVMFKPVDPGDFAARVRELTSESGTGRDATDLSPDVFYQRVHDIAEIPPLSPAVLDVFHMASSNDDDTDRLAANIARDASLAADILRAANSTFHNPSGVRIGELREAVVRLGRRRIAGLALARHAMFVTSSAGDLLDIRLAWRQSVGAGVAIELLAEAGGHQPTDERLFLCSVMHGLGRLMLMSLFPLVYRGLLKRCADTSASLLQVEAEVFPESHAKTLRSILERWGVPAHVLLPLNASADRFAEIDDLEEPLKTDVELVKIAALIGRLVAGGWEDWDEIDFPSRQVLKGLRLKSADMQRVIEQTSDDTEKLCGMSLPGGQGKTKVSSENVIGEIAYWQPPTTGMDWLTTLLPSLGLNPVHSTREAGERVLVNCLEEEGQYSEAFRHNARQSLLIARQGFAPGTSDAAVVYLPVSIQKLKSAIREFASP